VRLLVRDSRARAHARPPLRWLSAILALLTLCAAASWVLQPEQSAGLRSARPEPSAHVGRAPERVRLDFAASPAPGAVAEVVVLSPQDENLASGPDLVTPDGVTQPVAPLDGRGAYQVAYTVPLADGSVSTGQYWFWYAPTASGSSARLESPVLLGLLVAVISALLAGLLAPGRPLRHAVHVPAQRIGSATSTPGTSTNPVPTQRSRDRHDGLSPPGGPRRSPAPGQAAPEPTSTRPPRPL